MQRGGRTSRLFPQAPPCPNSSCLSRPNSISYRARALLGCPFSTTSIPISSPLPLTAPMKGERAAALVSPSSRQAPTFSAFSARFSCLMVLMTAIPSLVCMWPAAKVLNQTCLTTLARSLLVTTAASALPLPRLAPIVTTVGTWFCHLKPHCSLPILPKPVLDSSQMATPFLCWKRPTAWERYPCGAMCTPALAWRGSQTSVPGCPADAVSMTVLNSSTAALASELALGQVILWQSILSMWWEFQLPRLVTERALPTSPWQAFLKAQISRCSVCTCEIMSEKSMASPVELQRQTLSQPAPNCSRISCEYSPWVSFMQMVEVWMSLPAWSWMTLRTAGWLWPMLTVPPLAYRSRYLLPRWSNRYCRWPSVMISGDLQYVGQSCEKCLLRLEMISQGLPAKLLGTQEVEGSRSEEKSLCVSLEASMSGDSWEDIQKLIES